MSENAQVNQVAKVLEEIGFDSDGTGDNIPAVLYRFADHFVTTDRNGTEVNVPEGMRRIAIAIHENFTSPNEVDTNLEAANVVDGLFSIARAIHHLARAVEGKKPETEERSNGKEPAHKPRFYTAAELAQPELGGIRMEELEGKEVSSKPEVDPDEVPF